MAGNYRVKVSELDDALKSTSSPRDFYLRSLIFPPFVLPVLTVKLIAQDLII